MDMISEYSVLKQEKLNITTTPRPNLSCISKSLDREQILKIFYSRNKWEVTVSNFNYEVLSPITELNNKYGPMQLDISQDLTTNHESLKDRLMNRLHDAFHNKVLSLAEWEEKPEYEWSVRADRLATLFSFSRFLRDGQGFDWRTARLFLGGPSSWQEYATSQKRIGWMSASNRRLGACAAFGVSVVRYRYR